MTKISLAAFAALLRWRLFHGDIRPSSASRTALIQVPIPGMPGFGQQPPEQRGYQGGDDRERREHCERLRDREDEMRDRLQTAYGEDRERLEHRIDEVHGPVHHPSQLA